MSDFPINDGLARPAQRPRGTHLVCTLVGLVRSLPTGEASPLGQPTQFRLKPWLPYEADLTVTDVPGEPADRREDGPATGRDANDDQAAADYRSAADHRAVEDDGTAVHVEVPAEDERGADTTTDVDEVGWP